MNLTIMHPGAACSSLILFDFMWDEDITLLNDDEYNEYDGAYGSYGDFLEHLNALSHITIEDTNGEPFEVEDFSFVAASLDAISQKRSVKYLKKLGFTAGKNTYNHKNGTDVVFMMLDIPAFLKNLKQARKENKK